MGTETLARFPGRRSALEHNRDVSQIGNRSYVVITSARDARVTEFALRLFF